MVPYADYLYQRWRERCINLAQLFREIKAMRETLSNVQVEGHVNRLETSKRQMYGRGRFDLLRRRVLGTA